MEKSQKAQEDLCMLLYARIRHAQQGSGDLQATG